VKAWTGATSRAGSFLFFMRFLALFPTARFIQPMPNPPMLCAESLNVPSVCRATEEEIALWDAVFHGCSSRLESILKPELATIRDFNQMTPLMIAAMNGHAECVQSLLPDSDANAINKRGETALMLTFQGAWANTDSVRAVAQLLIPASDLELMDDEGVDALFCAMRGAHAQALPISVFSLFFPGALPDRRAGKTEEDAARSGMSPIQLAERKALWPVVDLFARFSSPETALGLSQRHGADRLPGLHAQIEAGLLRDAIVSVGQALAPGHARGTATTARRETPRL